MKNRKENIRNVIPPQLRAFFDNTTDMVFFKNVDLIYCGCSLAFARLVGLPSAEQVVGKSDYDLFDPILAEKYIDDDRRMLEAGKDLPAFIEPLPSQDGAPRWASTAKFISRDESGAVIGLYGIGRDVTQEIRLERESNPRAADSLRYRDTLANSRASIWNLDFATKSITASPNSVNVHGYDDVITGVPESLVESGYIHPDYAASYLEMHRKLAAGAKHVEGVFRVKGPLDQDYWYERIIYTNLFDDKGKPNRAIGMSEDVTESFMAPQTYNTEWRLQMAMVPDVINTLLLDVDDWKILRWRHLDPNIQALYYHAQPEELARAAAKETEDSEDIHPLFLNISKERLYEVYKENHTMSFEYLRRQPDGTFRFVRSEAQFMVDPTTKHLMLFYVLRDIDTEKRRLKELIQAAETDSMTGLLNHSATIKAIEEFIENCDTKSIHALFMIDMDKFKSINDTLGHQRGDDVIRSFADSIRGVFRQSDIIGRIGGDEFLILMKDASSINAACRKGREALSALQFHLPAGNQQLHLTASVGISVIHGEKKSFSQLYKEADAALYQAKDEGRNRCVIFDKQNDTTPVDDLNLTNVMQLHALLVYMDAGVVVADVDDDIKIKYISPSFYKTMGRTYEDTGYGGERMLNIVYPEDLPLIYSEAKKAASGQVADFVYRVNPDTSGWRHMRAVRLPDTLGAPAGTASIIAVITDVTEMKRSEEQLRQAEARYRIALRQIQGMIWEVDLATRTLSQSPDVNKTFWSSLQVFHNAPESIFASDIVHPDSIDECSRMFDDIYGGVEGNTYLLHLRAKDGNYVRVKTKFEFLRDLHGNPVRAVGVEEILANVEPELRIFENEKLFMKSIAPSLLTAVTVNLTRNTIETFHSRTISASVSKYTEFLDRVSAQIPFKEGRRKFGAIAATDHLLASYQSGQSWQYCEYRVANDDGKTRWVNLAINLLKHPVSGDVYAFEFFRDVDVVHRWISSLSLEARQDSATVLYNRDTLVGLWDTVLCQTPPDAKLCVTVLELSGLPQVKEERGIRIAQEALFMFGRICRVITVGEALIGSLDEMHVAIIRADYQNPEKQKANCSNFIQQIQSILTQAFAGISFPIAAGFTVSNNRFTGFDEVVRQALVACKLSDRLPSRPVCQYLQPALVDHAAEALASEAVEHRRLLVISDDAALRAKVRCILPKCGYLVDETSTAREGCVLIEQNNYALIVCQESLPDKTVWELLDSLRNSGLLNMQPMVILSEADKADSELRALRLGAADIIEKSAISEALRPRMLSIISRYESMRTAEQNKLHELRMEQKEQMLLLAEYDEVTGLYNRQAFYRRVREALDANPQTTYAIFRWDMDNFKMLNDFFGVATGDKVLRDLAVAAQEGFSDDTILCRLQSDHFIAFSPMHENLLEERYRVLVEMAENYPLDFHFSFRMGVYVITDPSMDVPLMCDRALLALRSVNNNYTNHIAFYDDSLRAKLVEEQELLGQFTKAIEDQEFVLYFQPQYDYSGENNLLISSEALVRWNHSEKGLLSPGRFIPLFEKTGFILALDQYVWERACQHLRDWIDRGIDPLPVSVNISRLSVGTPNIVEIFCSLIKQYDLDPSLLHLEITESAYMDDPELIIEVVQKFQHEGFFVEMDDFGSGYSSLNTLKDVPVDLLKLDMRFLSNTKNGARSGIIINSVLRMAHWLNMPVIAEGVETRRQAEYLKTSGCVLAQGYLFGKPMPASEYESLMERSKPASPEISFLSKAPLILRTSGPPRPRKPLSLITLSARPVSLNTATAPWPPCALMTNF